MNTKNTILLLFIFLVHACAIAQDKFSGTWQMIPVALEDTQHIRMQLQVAAPERDLLYPARLSIQYKDFTGSYLVLLARQGNRLAMSRDKFALSETPYSIGAWPVVLNGYLGLDSSNGQHLRADRIASKRFGIPMPAIMNYQELNRTNVALLSRFLQEGEILFEKKSSDPWRSGYASKMLYSAESPAYLGLVDSFITNTATARISFAENNRPDNDSITVTLNGKMLMNNMNLNRPEPAEITLEAGENILLLFAENFGRVPPNTAKMHIAFADKTYLLDFTNPANMSATFMAAKLYYLPDNKPSATQQRQIIAKKISERSTRVIDSVPATSGEIMLAIWDDAVEDGDSISLKINDDIYLPGIAVKKKPQFIPVKLNPGQNSIIFIADNLGSISPNTSILEIIDGKKRRSYMINTNFGVNNAIKISWDFEPAEQP